MFAMKNKISFLAVLAIALGVNYANASDCVDEDCELNSVVVVAESEPVDILEPHTVNENLWASNVETQSDCEYDYNCPFDSAEKCAIWYKKPVYKQAVYPREPHINPVKIDDIIYALNTNSGTSANVSVFAPLVERYNMLMRASKACCNEGIIYKLHNKNALDAQIYKFLKDDANYFAVGSRCLVMADSDISSEYSNGVDGQMINEVRDACLCKNRKWFDSLLNPFIDVYNRVPEFKSSAFEYKYTDGLNRHISVSINKDVQNAINMLANCPD